MKVETEVKRATAPVESMTVTLTDLSPGDVDSIVAEMRRVYSNTIWSAAAEQLAVSIIEALGESVGY